MRKSVRDPCTCADRLLSGKEDDSKTHVPRVGRFVRDDVNLTPVSDDESGSKKGTIRIFHPPVRERSRQDECVVPPPAVRTTELFRRADHAFGILLKLVRARVDLARFGPDAGPFAQGAEGEFTARDGDQVGRDFDFLFPDVLVFGPVDFGDSIL